MATGTGERRLTEHEREARSRLKFCLSTPPEQHVWPDDAIDGDTCQCGDWYRFQNRIEKTP